MNIASIVGGAIVLVTTAYSLLWRITEFPDLEVSLNEFVMRMALIGAIIAVFQALPVIIETRRYSRYLNRVKGFARAMGGKDLTQPIEITSRDEFGEIAYDLNALNKNFTEVVMLLRGNSKDLHALSSELTSLAATLSGTSSQQAASAEEIAASIEQTSANIANAADHANESAQVSVTTNASMDESYQLTNSTHVNVNQILDKISVIQELADQTNLLAINAFIEAANAGESGKGFAVVAKEIRTLADRSKFAAEEISELATQSKVNSEASVAKSQEMIAYITKTSEIAKLVSESSKEQHSSIDQINQTVQDFNKASQSLAASSQELSVNAGSLAERAKKMDNLLQDFIVQ
ncbi:MAG: methyl-accepting chemotaxis protein [Bacteroidota bacterium]